MSTLEPLEPESIVNILEKHPNIDAVLPTMGGQTALNLAIQCEEMGIWEEHNVRMIGVDTKAIDITENREAFSASSWAKLTCQWRPKPRPRVSWKGKRWRSNLGTPWHSGVIHARRRRCRGGLRQRRL